jgi:hypothetical protein
MTWDEGFYFERNRDAVIWLADWLRDDLSEEEGSDPLWEETWEYLAVPRFVHGLSGYLFGDHWLAQRHLLAPLIAQRLLNGVAHGLNAWLIGILLLPVSGLGPALAAMFAYGSVPRVFGYAHFATTETLTITVTLLVTLAFLRGLHTGPAAIMTGALFGLALNTKFNALLLPLPLWLWAWWHHRRTAANNIMAMVFIAPVVWFATWPWIWRETIPRLIAYLEHFLAHIQTSTFFHHRPWGWDAEPTPWFYPLEMLAVTTPLTVLILGLIGLYGCLRDGGPDGRARLFALLGVIPLAIACLPGTPRYDGVRLILPTLACLALVLGVAVGRLRDLAALHWPALFATRRRLLLVHGVFIAALALPGFVGILRVHPYELAFYNTLVGGLPGAVERGYETVFWCESLNEPAIEYINETLPEGALVRVRDDFSTGVLAHLQRWEVLRDDLRFERNPREVDDWALIQARQGMFRLWRGERFLWEQWRPESFRAFGWPRWRSSPIVTTLIVAETGPPFQAAVESHLRQEYGEEGYRAMRSMREALEEAQRSGL